ncbi:NAD(P)H-dependent oxidoreductase [Staphylococcus pasteuri]|uniref:NAD(P)H-dependent oxidoreductase n=1 Tax=Staphylococcus pasteuri TaxID=45972 RepID=UPI0032618E57
MISLIYAGNEKGKCHEVFQNVEQLLSKYEYRKFNLQNDKNELNELTCGYHTEMSDYQIKSIDTLNQSELLIFIYPLYWLNVPMILKGFIDMTFWPEHAFSFKKKQYFKNGLWKDKKAIIIYTLGGANGSIYYRVG